MTVKINDQKFRMEGITFKDTFEKLHKLHDFFHNLKSNKWTKISSERNRLFGTVVAFLKSDFRWTAGLNGWAEEVWYLAI